MKNINIQYQELLREILDEGYEYVDKKRNVKCKQIDETTLRIDLQEGFPAINLKTLYWKGVVGELLWFLRGDTNIKYLLDNNINIWNKDAYNHFLKDKPTIQISREGEEFKIVPFEKDNEKHINLFLGQAKLNGSIGDLGRVYGAQWRNWNGTMYEPNEDDTINWKYIDQISNVIKNLKEQPMSRRHIVTSWNPAELDDMALPPCHWSFEIIVRPLDNGYGFTLKWHQRSVDTYLG